MTKEEFRLSGYEAIDWITDYIEHIREYPVLARVKPGELKAAIPPCAPETGEPMDRIFEDFKRLIPHASTHWNHPAFFAYFATSASEPGILAELLTAALNPNGMLWKSSPAVTELEQVTLSWLRQWLGLDSAWFGIIYDTASTSTLHAVAAARQKAAPWTKAEGCDGRLTVYCSEHAHSSVDKAVMTLGLGLNNLRRIGVDAGFRMRPDLLEHAIGEDKRAGMHPCCIVATAGTTAMASIDPLPEIAAVAQANGVWLHVDGAYGGSAAIVESHRHILAGVESADSLVVNPHKWLLTPVDLSAFYTRHPSILRDAFSLVPEYLRTQPDPDAVNLMDYGFQLGRRFRALKLWFVMRHYGLSGLSAVIEEHLRLAQELSCLVQASRHFTLCAPVHLSLVCFRYNGTDDANLALMERLNASGVGMISHTRFNDQTVLRLAIGNFRTRREDLMRVWNELESYANGSG
jgi:aromatic-L-amino-acid decarboxylase